jgi:hypothetical protein
MGAVTLVVLSSFILPNSSFAQGSLTPPGAPAPTMKTLTQVEPRTPLDETHTPGDFNSVFRITQPGAYYLTGNLPGQSGRHGLKIDANDVTVDLNGFVLTGSRDALDGIHVLNLIKNLVIENGVIRGWSGAGVNATLAGNSRLHGLRASENGGGGLRVGNGSLITDCFATSNTGTGIVASINCVVRHCISAGNTGAGIRALDNSIVQTCIARQNGGNGIDTGTSCQVSSCVTRENGACGISLGSGAVRGSITQGNGTDGVAVGSGSALHENLCGNNGDSGIRFRSSSNLALDNLVIGFNPGGGFRSDPLGGSMLARNVGGVYSNLSTGCQVFTNLCPRYLTNPWANFQ